MMKTRADFQLDAPDLKEMVLGELWQEVDQCQKEGREPPELPEDGIAKLMERVYERIEREALDVFKSSEPLALKAWAYSTILRDTVAGEVTEPMVDHLMSPVQEWQNKQAFDPLGHFKERSDFERKSQRTKECYMLTAARFVSKVGRKHRYTDEDIETYLSWANKHYTNQDSYYQECQRLLQFLRRLPGADRQRELPIRMPKMPDEFYQPTFSDEEIQTLIWATVLDDIPPNMVGRLFVATVYGARRSELTELSSADIHLNGVDSNIYIRTKKGGQRKRQPIPQSLTPIFVGQITPMHGHTLQRQLKKICKNAGVLLPFRGGYHCFRRSTVTAVSNVEASDTNVSNFMRWAKPRTMLARYKQTPIEVTDKAILEKHPYVKIWEEVVPYLLRFNSHYHQGIPLIDNT